MKIFDEIEQECNTDYKVLQEYKALTKEKVWYYRSKMIPQNINLRTEIEV